MLAVDTGGIQTVFKHYTALRLVLGMSESAAKSDSRRFLSVWCLGAKHFAYVIAIYSGDHCCYFRHF